MAVAWLNVTGEPTIAVSAGPVLAASSGTLVVVTETDSKETVALPPPLVLLVELPLRQVRPCAVGPARLLEHPVLRFRGTGRPHFALERPVVFLELEPVPGANLPVERVTISKRHLVVQELNHVPITKDEVVTLTVARIGVKADASPGRRSGIPGCDLDLGRNHDVAGIGLVGDHGLLGIGRGSGVGLAQSAVADLPCSADKRPGRAGGLELNVSWNRTGLALTVTVTVLTAGIPSSSVTVNWAV